MYIHIRIYELKLFRIFVYVFNFFSLIVSFI